MESKEEILNRIRKATGGCKRPCSPSDMIGLDCKCDRDISAILDEYAQQMAIEFAEWEEANKREIESVDGKFYTINIIGRYQIFLNEKQK